MTVLQGMHKHFQEADWGSSKCEFMTVCFLKKEDSTNSKYFRLHDPGPSEALLLVFTDAGVEETGRKWGPRGPCTGRHDGQKRGKCLPEKMSVLLPASFHWPAETETGHFLPHSFQDQSHRLMVGSFLCWLWGGCVPVPVSMESLLLCGGLQSDNTHKERGETIIQPL